MTLNTSPTLRDWLVERSSGSKKSTSVLLSFIGDVVIPHDGAIGLGSLVKLGELLGITEQTVRSAANRLAVDGWLTAEIHGRRSFFMLTDFALTRFHPAIHRIYHHADTEWEGEWQLVMIDPSGLGSDEIEEINRDLSWIGFGRFSPGVFIRPKIAGRETCEDLKVNPAAQNASVCFTGWRPPCASDDNLRPFIRRLWDLDAVTARYKAFIQRYDPLLAAIWSASSIDGELALALRTFMIHDFRRIRLVDPQLPPELQEANWIGNRALYIAHEIYDFLLAPSEDYVMSHFEGPAGRLPQLSMDFYERFGGLSR